MKKTNLERIQTIEKILAKQFEPQKLQIIDDSAKHKGHKGAEDGRGHFRIVIASPQFANKSLVECHRMVYAALGDLMRTDIHALQILVEHITNADAH